MVMVYLLYIMSCFLVRSESCLESSHPEFLQIQRRCCKSNAIYLFQIDEFDCLLCLKYSAKVEVSLSLLKCLQTTGVGEELDKDNMKYMREDV